MPITSYDLKDLAERLVSEEADEAVLRAACSRAYYSGFHALLPFVSRLPRSESCPENVRHVTHQEMSDRLREWKTDEVHPALAAKSITKGNLRRALDTARALRVKADYRLEDLTKLGEARMQVERARLILRMVEQIEDLAGLPKTASEAQAHKP